VTLLVDPRQGSHELVAPLRKLGLPVEETWLDAGDVAFTGKGEAGTPLAVGIEYKKLEECVAALRSERLQGHQIPAMQERFAFSYLVVEGEWHVDLASGFLGHVRAGKFLPIPGQMRERELRSRLNGLHLARGLIWRRTTNRRDSLEEIAALYRCWTEHALDEHRSAIAIYRPKPLMPISEFRVFLQSVPGIGFTVSKAADAHFGGSIRKAVLATEAEWRDVDGVGKALAARLVRSFA
jgi:ERCC4-type nuclease